MLTKAYRNYVEKGTVYDEIAIDKVKETPYRILMYAKYQMVLGKPYIPVIHTSLLKYSQTVKDPFLQKELSLCMIEYLQQYAQKQPHLFPLLEAYLLGIDASSLNQIDSFRYRLLTLNILMKKSEWEKDTMSHLNIEEQLMQLNAIRPAVNFYKAIVEKTAAIYHIEFTKNKEKAQEHLKKASVFFASMKNYMGVKQQVYTQNSLGILLRDLGSYTEAITIFESLLDSKPIKENVIALLKVHTSLEKCYAALNFSEKAHYHAKAVNRLQDSIYRLRQTEAILEKNYDYHLAENERKIYQAKVKERSLYQWLLLLIPILGISVLMIFFLYRIYKKSRKEVKKITQLVIKNHIVLKDKTKIYINDLLYIKAEDHYIRVYTSDGKNHLVRGKLGDIAIQLPPNFVRTHRSYITNRNFVRQVQRQFLVLMDGTEIPISRNFQKQWT